VSLLIYISSFCAYALILYIFVLHCKIVLFIIHILREFIPKNIKLGDGLAAYLRTFSQGLSLCKPQLFAESLDW